MALRTTRRREDDPKVCPRCTQELISIDGRLTKWLTCQSCKWKKLVAKENDSMIHVTPLSEPKREVL